MSLLRKIADDAIEWFMLILVVGLVGNVAVAAAPGGSAELRQRQQAVDAILRSWPVAKVQANRALCANGQRGAMQGLVGGYHAANAVADECLALLTRAAREGKWQPVGNGGAPAAAAVDQGFMGGFKAGGPVPSTLLSMAQLKPVAERCFRQREPNSRLCSAAGYGLGRRIAAGEALLAG